MDSIILYLIIIIQDQYKQICYLLLFICKYIPLKQWAFDDMAFEKFKEFPGKTLKFIADGYSAYPNMPAKWIILIRLGQQTILNMQRTSTTAS